MPRYRRSLLVALPLCIAVTAVQSAQDAVDCLTRRLKELQPLPKPHYSFPLPDWMLTPSNTALREFARVTHGVSIRGESATAMQVDAAVQACKGVSGSHHQGDASIAVNYSPWYQRFGDTLAATDNGPT